MAEGVIYRHAVEAFVERVLRRRELLTPEFTARLRSLGLDATRPHEVDLETWALLVRAAAAQLAPNETIDDALEEVGHEVLLGYSETLVGRSLFALLRLLGPQRAMLRMAENYHSADSVTHVDARTLSPTSVELSFNTTGGLSPYVRGVLLETLHQVKAREPRVTFESNGDAVVFRIGWSA
ncbi:MAG: DUF2378 family protein [Archangium sp.]